MSSIALKHNNGGGGAGKANAIWVTGAARVGGTFLSFTNADSVNGEATRVLDITTDAPSVQLTIIADRNGEFEPTITVNGVVATRASGNTTAASTTGTFQWTVTIPVAAQINLVGSDNGSAAITMTLESAAIVSDLSIVNRATDFYPAGQTEVKYNDSMFISFTVDKDINQVIVTSTGAGKSQTVNVTPGTTFVSVQVTCGSTTVTPTLKNISINTRTITGSISSTAAVSSNQILCNNRKPSLSFSNVVYPAGQTALKNSETVSLTASASNFTSLLYSSPIGQISISNPTTDESTKIITRIGGSYNDNTSNLRCVLLRAENGSSTTVSKVIYIANVAPVITITDTANMKSGGNNGTSIGNYTVTIGSTQRLQRAPTIVNPSGTLTAFNYSWTSKSFTATISVHDSDAKGTFPWNSLVVENGAGISTTVISGNSDYTFKGIKSRSLNLPAFGSTVTVNAVLLSSTESQVTVFWDFSNSSQSYNPVDALAPGNFTIINNTGTSFDVKLLDAPQVAASSASSTLTIG